MPKPSSTDAVPDVLLVLGDPRSCEPLSALLELAGCRTVAVDRGTEATALLTERRFDLVILDVTLPDTEALRHSRRLSPRPPGRPAADRDRRVPGHPPRGQSRRGPAAGRGLREGGRSPRSRTPVGARTSR
ncbi:response regulator [Streptomyces sp. NPDC051243]|uniref:response regulator n=1 Tax=Streptomyces sp. NPDC051243 TaxID=3365646 RepID=UPI0037889E23